MQQDKPKINLTVPTGWDKLDDHQLRYVFGLLAQGFPSPQVKTYCLFRWTGMQVMHKYGKGWWCKFADDEFVIMAEQVNSAIAALDWIDSLPSKPVRISRIGKHRALTADFQEVPFETFIICDNLYQGYLSAKEDALLDDLATQLYKSSKVTPTEAERIGVFYWFASLKEMFARQFKHFFKPISNAGDPSATQAMPMAICLNRPNPSTKSCTRQSTRRSAPLPRATSPRRRKCSL